MCEDSTIFAKSKVVQIPPLGVPMIKVNMMYAFFCVAFSAKSRILPPYP